LVNKYFDNNKEPKKWGTTYKMSIYKLFDYSSTKFVVGKGTLLRKMVDAIGFSVELNSRREPIAFNDDCDCQAFGH
jgi:hypothetical protein